MKKESPLFVGGIVPKFGIYPGAESWEAVAFWSE